MSDEQRRQAATRLRSLADAAAVTDPADGWAPVLADLDRALARFDDEGSDQPTGEATDLATDLATDRTRFARGFADAAHHPLSEGTSGVYPPIDLEVADELLVARVRFGPAWEGPPDLVHGGYLAAGFDMVLSAMAHHVLGHSVTRRLQVRYLKPTFLGAALRYEVEADAPHGRLLDLRGRLYADDQITMRASAQFASLDEARFADRRKG